MSNMQSFEDCPVLVWRLTGIGNTNNVSGCIRLQGEIIFATPATQEFKYSVEQRTLREIASDNAAVHKEAFVLDAPQPAKDTWAMALDSAGSKNTGFWKTLCTVGRKFLFTLLSDGALCAVVETVSFIIDKLATETFDSANINEDVLVQVASVTPIGDNAEYQNISIQVDSWTDGEPDETITGLTANAPFLAVNQDGRVLLTNTLQGQTTLQLPNTTNVKWKYANSTNIVIEGLSLITVLGTNNYLRMQPDTKQAFIDSGISSDFFLF